MKRLAEAAVLVAIASETWYKKSMQMKSTRHALLLVLLFLLPVLTVGAVEPFRIAGTANADRLRIRTEPNLTADTVGHLAAGTSLEILDVTPEEMVIGDMSARWYKIRSLPGGDGFEGWSYGYFIDVRPEDLLAKAIWLDQPELVQELIRAGADVNAALTEEGADFTEYEEYAYLSRPLMEAVRAERPDTLDLLLAFGAHPDAEFTHGEPGGSVRGNSLVTAVERGNRGIVEALVDGGANFEAEMMSFGGGGDRYQVTPLSAAVERADSSVVEYLLAGGADPNHSLRYSSLLGGTSWKSPLDLAQERDLADIADLIRDFGGETAAAQ
jgi:Ankyrin repeats (3 copies)/Bacterial SH3 domain